jgi:hypothetical protein
MTQDVVLGILTRSPKSRKTPGLSSWVIFSRPCGTGSSLKPPGLRPGLLSAVPPGLNLERLGLTQTLKPD